MKFGPTQTCYIHVKRHCWTPFDLEKKLLTKKKIHLPYLPSIKAGTLVRVTADITTAT